MCYDNSGICINYIRLINLNVLYIYIYIYIYTYIHTYLDHVWIEFYIKLKQYLHSIFIIR